VSKKTHQKELERARAKRQAERAAQQRSRRLAAVVVVVLVTVIAVVVGLALRDDGDPGITDPGDTTDPTTDPGDVTEPGTDPGDDPPAGACPEPVDAPPVRDLQYDQSPEMQIDPETTYTATIRTSCGDMVVELFAADAPLTVNNFVFLAREGFYDGVIFHRVIEGFMIQGGDPTGTGTGGPGYRFEDELDTVDQYGFARGNLAMANSGPDTNGSQFFIVHDQAGHLRTHTVFGRVLDGLDTLDAIATSPVDPGDRPLVDVVILGIDIVEVPA
jgi:cyclophilin family peptidyl-prolyl cis-trans isomerase